MDLYFDFILTPDGVPENLKKPLDIDVCRKISNLPNIIFINSLKLN